MATKTNKQKYSENYSAHLEVIAQSMDEILNQTQNTDFKERAEQLLATAKGKRRSIRLGILRRLEQIYQDKSNHSKEKKKRSS